ncbi:ankyrin repeat domain-containing protein 34B [Salarias fasciatus]|uniref:ankyrin repeat domain-containing protein 34B n=1 Tax=Salarias fasciatus TaxID=181472 RepID=UPI0011764EDB|nr:ankyrin repeat domain-containing protein 34B-like [Salarias fasciatus]
MDDMVDPLSDCSPLISAAAGGRLRLVRLLVEGGAQVNGRNSRGETALLAVCKALRGEPAGPQTVKLLSYLLGNKADPNAQDWCGRTALMYACMERAGAQVASALLSAGADPSTEDHSGASALVYAINAQDQPTLKVLMDACQARGRDIIIIATETGVNGGAVTRRYLNVPPTPDSSPVSCMSPSDIVLKTGPANSPEGENVFNFRGTSGWSSSSERKREKKPHFIYHKPNKKHGQRKWGGGGGGGGSRHPISERSPSSQCSIPPPRQRISSEPWLAIHNLACLSRAYREGMRERSLQEAASREDLEPGGEEDEDKQPGVCKEGRHGRVQRRDSGYAGGNYSSCREDCSLRASQSVLSLNEIRSSHAQWSGGGALVRCVTPDRKLPARPSPLLHLPPLGNQSGPHLQVPNRAPLSKSRSMVFLPHPPGSSPPSSTCRASPRPVALPPLALASSLSSLFAPPRGSPRRHSVQLEMSRGAHEDVDPDFTSKHL